MYELLNCDYYPPEAVSDTCIHFNVTCELPPNINNTYIQENNVTYGYANSSQVQAESTVKYGCKTGYYMDGDPKIKCEYSGFWTTQPKCNAALTCELPPDIENSFIEESHVTYSYTNSSQVQAESIVKYGCKTGYIMDGNSTLRCRYSGFWTTQPKCNLALYIILPSAIAALMVILVTLTAFCLLIRRSARVDIITADSPDFVSREREYDSFVSYDSEGTDEDFVRDNLYPKLELENNPPLKIFFHKRDFSAGTLIHANIANAINKSNSGIVILSQDFIDSRWCIEEFDWFLAEQRKDPCFLIFAIIMQDLETLKRCPAQLAKFINENTGLEKDDPELWTKLSKLLLALRGTEHDELREETTKL